MRLKNIYFNSTDAKREDKYEVNRIDVGLNFNTIEEKNGGLAIKFSYGVRYNPRGGYLNLSGSAYFEGDKGEVKDALLKWKKDKKITGELGEQLVNQLTNASALNAIFITRVLDLGPPMLLPQVTLTEKPTVKK